MFYETAFLKNEEIQLILHHTCEADPSRLWLPTYYFRICDPEGVTMGWCDLRIGHNENTYYGGNIGYQVEKSYRGHHYAGKAVNLLFELARLHGLTYLIITCDPGNVASRKTCEYAGGKLIEIAKLPEENDTQSDIGETEKCVYRFVL